MHLEVGRLGEDLACRLLWHKGFRILERNYRGGRGEIDIIAEKAGRIRFIEVKTRTSTTFGPPEERVDAKKRQLVREAAAAYLSQFREAPSAGFQFDIVAQIVNLEKRQPIEQTLIEDAL